MLVLLGVVAWNLAFAGMPRLPSATDLWTQNREPAVQFVDMKGETVAIRGNRYGKVVRGDELPPYVGQAFIAAEDQRFMQHHGIDVQAIFRAAFANFSAGHTVQGGSTLTQQLVKNLLVGNEQSLRRKAQEARLAVEMESRLSKQEILDLYLNRVYLGSNAYGVEAAAQAYFDKPASDLSLTEAAFLAALPKAPSRYAEDKTGEETTARVHYVLDRMVESGFVTAEEAADAKAKPLVFAKGKTLKPISGHVLDEALKEARALVPNLPPDAVIKLTIDGDLQRKAEAALDATLSARHLRASEGAIVVMDRDGSIRALVGGRDYSKSQFNRATQALRQPGSAFKTFVYAAALERGFDPMTVRNDAPVQFGNWQPANYENEYRGPITLAQALAVSSNSVAAQVGTEIGPASIAKLAKRFGIESSLQAYPSITLGADEVTLLEMTRAYGVLANQGWRAKTHLVSEIRDQRGELLYEMQKEKVQVYDPDAAATLTGMLSNVVRFGTGAQAQIPGWQIAGKTGTSQSWRDAWFVGYSARMVGGVWIGNDDEKSTRKVTGGGAAAALFAKVMTVAHRDLKPEPLPGVDLAETWLDTGFYESLDDEGIEDPALGEAFAELFNRPDIGLPEIEAAPSVTPDADVTAPAPEKPRLPVPTLPVEEPPKPPVAVEEEIKPPKLEAPPVLPVDELPPEPALPPPQ